MVVRFIGLEIEGCPWVPGISSPFVPLGEKPSLVFIKPRRKARVQKFCVTPQLVSSASVPAAAAWPSPGSCLEPALESARQQGPRRLLGLHGY